MCLRKMRQSFGRAGSFAKYGELSNEVVRRWQTIIWKPGGEGLSGWRGEGKRRAGEGVCECKVPGVKEQAGGGVADGRAAVYRVAEDGVAEVV